MEKFFILLLKSLLILLKFLNHCSLSVECLLLIQLGLLSSSSSLLLNQEVFEILFLLFLDFNELNEFLLLSFRHIHLSLSFLEALLLLEVLLLALSLLHVFKFLLLLLKNGLVLP